MSTTTSVHAQIKAALDLTDLHVEYGPAKDIPAGGQAAVLWPSAGLHTYTRATGTRSGRTDRVTITCVGATSYDALAVADKVEAAIGGMRLSARGGTLRQEFVTQPVPEPNADPRRVSLAVEYSTTTKG